MSDCVICSGTGFIDPKNKLGTPCCNCSECNGTGKATTFVTPE